MDTVFLGEGNLLDHIAAAELKAGEIKFLGTICTQVTVDAAVGQTVGLRSEGVIRVTKEDSSDEYDDGDAVIWNATAKAADPDGVDGTMGKAVNGGSADGEAYVYVKLNA